MNDLFYRYVTGISAVVTIIAAVINITMQSQLFIILVFIFLTVAFLLLFIRQFIKMNTVGIINIFPQEDNDLLHKSKLKNKIENAKIIRLFFTTGRIFFINNKDALSTAINNGAKIQVLLAKKDSTFLSDVAIMEKKYAETLSLDSIHKEVDDVYDKISLIRAEQSAKVKGEISVKYYETEFRMSMILIESAGKNDWGWVTVTLPPAKAINTISFEIEQNKHATKDNMYTQCKTHFEDVWEKIADEK